MRMLISGALCIDFRLLHPKRHDCRKDYQELARMDRKYLLMQCLEDFTPL